MAIDWSQIGPAGSPTPSTPDTTAPVAPAAPGGLSALVSGAPQQPTAPTGRDATQAQVDAMSPLDRLGRGIAGVADGSAFDTLGQNLFGRGNGSPLGGVPGLGDIVGAAGNVFHGVANNLVVKPFEEAGAALSHVPLGWVPGGADDSFRMIGDWAKTNDPKLYQQWQAVNAASSGDILNGGNMKADFNVDAAKYLDDQAHDSTLGSTPSLVIGKAGVGSLGGALSATIQSFLGIASNTTQGILGNAGLFDPSGHGGHAGTIQDAIASKQAVGRVSDDAEYAIKQFQSGAFTEQQANDYLAKNENAGRDRVQESAARLDAGGDVSDVEKHAVEAFRSGAWSEQHANDYIVSHGQGVTRNPVGQALVTAITDPLTYATIGAGSVSSLGAEGIRAGEAAFGEAYNGLSTAERAAFAAKQATTYEKLAATVAAVQKDSTMGPVFRIMRGMIDPLAVYKPNSVDRAVTDLVNATSVKAFERAYGAQTFSDLRAIGREFGMTPELDSAIASYTKDQGNLMVARKGVRDILQQGQGEQLLKTNIDDLVEPLAANAPADAETALTDFMAERAKNTFTSEEHDTLAGRLAKVFGKDVPYWEERMKSMSFDLQSALHAATYKRSEVDFEQAKAVAAATYTGKIPLHKAVLMTSDTLDNVTAGDIIDNIKGILKNDQPENITTATNEWNAQARRYPAMDTIGYAPGGRAQVEKLVAALEKKLQNGGITKRVLDEELADPELAPIRDFLDRNSVPIARDVRAELPQAGEGFDAWRQRLWDDLKNNGKPIPSDLAGPSGGDALKTGGPLYRAMSDAELAAAEKSGEFKPLLGKDLFVTNDPDRLAGGSFGATKGGAIVEFDPSITTHVAKARNANLEELAAESIPYSSVKRIWKWDPNAAPADIRAHSVIGDHTLAVDNTVGPTSKPLWKIGMRPDEEVAAGLARDPNTGLLRIDRDPTISHVIDAVPGRQPFSDTTRNALSQVIGTSKAERLNGPVDSIEAFINTAGDVVTGRRLVNNIQNRFERSMFDIGVPRPLTQQIMDKAREVAGLDHTTIRGIQPDNLWKQINESINIPRDLVLKDGSTMNIHVIMDHLLQASEGDLRIMGATSVFSQRVRNWLHAHGDSSNWSGQMTVTMYNKLRYSQPMFLIQRVTDAPYFSMLYGSLPVGAKAALTGTLARVRAIEDNLGRTGLARFFSMDMPEYATRSNFTAGIKSKMQEIGLKNHDYQRILDAPDAIIASNMTNMLYSRMGDIFKGTLENLASAAEKDPSLKAEMLQAGETLTNSVADWRRVMSESAGHVVDDNEAGLQYIEEIFNGWRSHVVNPDGSLDFSRLIHDGERALPDDIGAIGPIRPDSIAQSLGYTDGAALRRDVMGHPEKVNGDFALVNGEHDIPWLEQQMRDKLHAHPDVTRRVTAYFGDNWDGFWHRMSLGADKGGLDISPHYAKEAQDLIATWAKDRGMDPWEYLSGVMASNIGAKDLNTYMGQLMGFLKAGKAKQPLEEWTKMYRATLDVSAQRELMREFESAVPIEDVMKVPTPAKFAKDHSGNTVLPQGFGVDPGYVYRVDTLSKARSGWASHTRIETDASKFSPRGDPGEGVFRVKAGAADITPKRSLTKAAIPPENIEMLGEDGKWAPLGTDPMDTIMSKEFPEMIRQRLISDVVNPAAVPAKFLKDARGNAVLPSQFKHEPGYFYRVKTPEQMAGGVEEGAGFTAKPNPTYVESDAHAIYRVPKDHLRVPSGKGAGGADMEASRVIPPNEMEVLGADGSWHHLPPDSGTAPAAAAGPHPNPEIEGYIQQFSKWVQDSIKDDLGAQTRHDLRRLVQQVPTAQATPFNRSEALVVSLLKDKIEGAQQDVFRLAEMQTKRTVLERSMNHPLLGLYPVSYMWGKVLPETVKFLAKNPYAATYTIADVQRAIALQREFDPEVDQQVSKVDRSAGSFLFDYLTPGLPWSDHQARMSPLVRDIMSGQFKNIPVDEANTVSPLRWGSAAAGAAAEVPGVVNALTGGSQQSQSPQQSGLQGIVNAPTPTATEPSQPSEITGPTKASALAPILQDDLSRLQSILLQGQKP